MSKTEGVSLSLRDYAADREFVVLFRAGVGVPMGDHTPLGHSDFDDWGLLDLTGTVDGAGGWRWDGEGGPVDHRSCSITKLHAFVDAIFWTDLLAEKGGQ